MLSCFLRLGHYRDVPGTGNYCRQPVEDRASPESLGRGAYLLLLPASAVRSIRVGSSDRGPLSHRRHGASCGPCGSAQQSQVQFVLGSVHENSAKSVGAASLLGVELLQTSYVAVFL